MSGPVIGTNNAGSVWGSATGLLINWQPFDFGLRNAKVEAAAAARDRANASVQRSQLEVSSPAADVFLTVLAARQTQNSAQVAVDNWEILRKSIHALTAAELRPAPTNRGLKRRKRPRILNWLLQPKQSKWVRQHLRRFS
jgi:outer membrane protein